jgi:hypothetical protein
MLRLVCLSVSLSIAQAATPARPPQGGATDIKALLTAYEKRDAALPPDPEALGKIARLVMAKTARSQLFRVWSEECASTFVTDKAGCDTKLRGVLDDTTKPVAMRVAAGAVLMKHGDAKASNTVLGLLNNLSTSDLIPLVPIVRQLPRDRAEGVLLKMLASPVEGDKIAACRALGAFDSPAVRQALHKTVTEAPPGLAVWKACTLARVQLKEPDTVGAINGISHEMTPDALLDAADVMVATANELVIHLLQRVAREGSPGARMDAARRLADLDPELAARVVDAGLGNADPDVRARALIAERHLKRAPSATVRKLLLDPIEIVQLRAAEAVLDWVARTRK